MSAPTANGFSSFANSRALAGAVGRHPLFSFFLLSYAGSWLFAMPSILAAWGHLDGDYTVLYALRPWAGPALAAILVTGITEGGEGLSRLRQSIRRKATGWGWYAFVLLGIPALVLLGLLVQPGLAAGFRGLAPRTFPSYLVSFAAVFVGVGLPEEIGWRGFALPRLQLRYGPFWGTLRLGILWALWHLPYFLTPSHGGGPGTSPATFVANFTVFFLMVMALSIAFTWVYNHTRGSGFIAGLMHTSIDTPQLVFVPLFLEVSETSLNVALLLPFGLLALLIVIATRGQLGYVPDE